MKTGDKVICINDNFPPHCFDKYSELPLKGRVYVVRDSKEWMGQLGIWLIGISGVHNTTWNDETGFCAWRFRLLSEMKQEAKERAGLRSVASQQTERAAQRQQS